VQEEMSKRYRIPIKRRDESTTSLKALNNLEETTKEVKKKENANKN
jgi:RNase H-fold protein (predicted Holliday junction resolvase)